jgi:hypothetical protein
MKFVRHRYLSAHISAFPAVLFAGIEEIAGQDLSQPAGQLTRRAAADVPPILVRFQQRLLDDIGRTDAPTEPAVELLPGQQEQVRAETIEVVNRLRVHGRLAQHVASCWLDDTAGRGGVQENCGEWRPSAAE